MKKLLVILSLCLFISSMAIAGKKDPVGVLFQVKGKVEYTKNGKKWKKVRRTKFLFSGYQVKTGPDSTVRITIKETGKNFDLHPDSMVAVNNGVLAVNKGTMTPAAASGALMSGLMKKFNKSQSYTTVRRSHKKSDIKISSVREVTISNSYPYMAWDNIGNEYSYKLTVGEKSYDISATDDAVVRARVEPFEGTKAYKITALKDGNAVVTLKPYKSRGQYKDHKITWLSGDDKMEVEKTISDIQSTYGENSFMMGSYFEKKDMWVASMDQYQQYLQEFPDEIEMTPYLFRVYKKLKLNSVYKKELEQWKQAMIE
jgi:magnetotaxis MtxA-like protein